jgi:hypothetical protein
LTDNHTYLSDDVMRVGVAALVAVEDFNKRGNIVPAVASLSPRIRLSFEMHDSGSTISGGLAALLSAGGGGVCEVDDYPILGVVGAGRSAVSGPLSLLASVKSIPVISYWSSSPDLSDKETYPTFGRTFLSDEITAHALVGMMQGFGWGSVALVYPNDLFGNGFQISFQRFAYSMDLTLAAKASYNIGDERSIRGAMESVRDSEARIIAILKFPVDNEDFLSAAESLNMIGADYVYIGASETSYGPPSTRMQTWFRGSLRLGQTYGYGEPWEEFQNQWKARDVSTYQAALNDVTLTNGTTVQLPAGLFDNPCPDLCSNVYDAVWALGLSLDGASDPTRGKAVMEHLAKSPGFSATSINVSFDDNFDRKPGGVTFVVEQFMAVNQTEGHWVPVGFVPHHRSLRVSSYLY